MTLATKLKPNEIRGIINDLTTVAQTYGATQQCRERIAQRLVPVLENHKIIHDTETNRKQFEDYLKQNYSSSGWTAVKYHNGKYSGTVYLKTDALELIRVQHLWEVWNHVRS